MSVRRTSNKYQPCPADDRGWSHRWFTSTGTEAITQCMGCGVVLVAEQAGPDPGGTPAGGVATDVLG